MKMKILIESWKVLLLWKEIWKEKKNVKKNVKRIFEGFEEA